MIPIRYSAVDTGDIHFVRYIPLTLKSSDATYRNGEFKWPTFRYILDLDGRKFRVKGFFLDWFSLGFPKSLISNLTRTFSEIESVQSGDCVFFIGKNHGGMDSASSYIHGTQAEIEAIETSSKDDFHKIYSNL